MAPTISKDETRALFASALSEMYRREVPQYGTLLELVSDINNRNSNSNGVSTGDPLQNQPRIEVERHGAIRLGKPEELSTMRRLFAIMGMHPVGYYDLTVAGLPVHATSFRPISHASLSANPFRVFTSLLRLDMVSEEGGLRSTAQEILSQRQIFTPRCLALLNELESEESYPRQKAEELLQEALETFRWHKSTTVDKETYQALQAAHPLVADVVCFRGPHINHLTPRVVDIEAAQIEMQKRGLNAKDHIEGPPVMKWPILLRQTSFLALEEQITFSDGTHQADGKHKARFGEIEQRGMALTPKGRRLYDELMGRFHHSCNNSGRQTGSDPRSSDDILREIFEEFPDDLEALRRDELAYFRYHVQTPRAISNNRDLSALVKAGTVQVEPITYEDFLPISAAGIFCSNLGSLCANTKAANSDRTAFERALGCTVQSEFEVYETIQKESIEECWEILKSTS
ncbi:hypothetical protein ASPVEDRAFT_38696 [Aspergillus versicolor CBS 583.65]|uniref:2-oxoadipate dioxygenase/decarboxylase n=1 Tax=Aspergillus versicolor CBS 583.65 TaxID=1036611 RepID=A0A1L9PCM9_ASPVE|nr:uncharacterized protein ASPVEDRAFT_38696 [Aspergillus versicolor CBS 583.65]OJI99233.1 hypothetical protein ASPVEDRAFT_38696 [Aspergillus versicolor CBS 583.65]